MVVQTLSGGEVQVQTEEEVAEEGGEGEQGEEGEEVHLLQENREGMPFHDFIPLDSLFLI